MPGGGFVTTAFCMLWIPFNGIITLKTPLVKALRYILIDSLKYIFHALQLEKRKMNLRCRIFHASYFLGMTLSEFHILQEVSREENLEKIFGTALVLLLFDSQIEDHQKM